ncbi:SGNH/GDSL hydrolase family protein [Demequina sp.]|uniref:SGNH/GDSL hydrolase family protein n=1 Tax=Demequina sp. TaxID=2050685 RepID=UPI003D116700
MRIAFVGDSFTEGVGDERSDGSLRGWADMVAKGLAVNGGEHVHYANFAVRGRLLERIATEQVDQALALTPPPDLLVINGGGNDMLRPGYTTAACVALLSGVVERAAEAGADLLILSGPDPSDNLPNGAAFHRRGRELTDAIPSLISGLDDVRFVNCFDDAELRDRSYWCEDRLHLNARGHERVAALVLTVLGVATPLPARGEAASPRTKLGDAAYTVRHVAPWVGRRIMRRSSGDGRSAKHPQWIEIALVQPQD